MDRELPDRPTLLRAVALTTTGERLGLVVDVPDDVGSSAPGWAWIRTGVAATDVSPVPLSDARYANGSLIVSTTAAAVERAPRHPLGTPLSAVHQRELREHYALPRETALPADQQAAQVAAAVGVTSADERGLPAGSHLGDVVRAEAAPSPESGGRPARPARATTPAAPSAPAAPPTPGRTQTARAQTDTARRPRRDLLVDGLETARRRLDVVLRRIRR